MLLIGGLSRRPVVRSPECLISSGCRNWRLGLGDMSSQSCRSFIENLERAPAFKRQSLLLDYISEIVQDIRKVQHSKPLEASQRLLALGLPSLQLIELK